MSRYRNRPVTEIKTGDRVLATGFEWIVIGTGSSDDGTFVRLNLRVGNDVSSLLFPRDSKLQVVIT